MNINKFKKSYGYLKVNSSQELLEAIPFLDKGEGIILTEKFSDDGELLNPVSREEHQKIKKIIENLKIIARAKNLKIEKFKWFFDNNSVNLTIEKLKLRKENQNEK